MDFIFLYSDVHGPCQCINENGKLVQSWTKENNYAKIILFTVDIDFKIMNKNSIQVNCSQMNYVSHVDLTIKANKEQSLKITCDILNSDAQIVIFDHVTFECDKSHLIEAYYYYQDKECAVSQVTRELPCSGLHYYD